MASKHKQQKHEQVHAALSLFLLAHLSLAADADAELAKHSLTRTHHRILYLVTHGPGVTVGRVVDILRLTPQAVQGPMRRLLNEGLLEQKASAEDRRRRHLYATPKGEALLRTVSEKQFQRIARAFAGAPETTQDFCLMLSRLVDPQDRLWTQDAPILDDEARASLTASTRRRAAGREGAAVAASQPPQRAPGHRPALKGRASRT